jgi:hypothetical protein
MYNACTTAVHAEILDCCIVKVTGYVPVAAYFTGACDPGGRVSRNLVALSLWRCPDPLSVQCSIVEAGQLERRYNHAGRIR